MNIKKLLLVPLSLMLGLQLPIAGGVFSLENWRKLGNISFTSATGRTLSTHTVGTSPIPSAITTSPSWYSSVTQSLCTLPGACATYNFINEHKKMIGCGLALGVFGYWTWKHKKQQEAAEKRKQEQEAAEKRKQEQEAAEKRKQQEDERKRQLELWLEQDQSAAGKAQFEQTEIEHPYVTVYAAQKPYQWYKRVSLDKEGSVEVKPAESNIPKESIFNSFCSPEAEKLSHTHYNRFLIYKKSTPDESFYKLYFHNETATKDTIEYGPSGNNTTVILTEDNGIYPLNENPSLAIIRYESALASKIEAEQLLQRHWLGVIKAKDNIDAENTFPQAEAKPIQFYGYKTNDNNYFLDKEEQKEISPAEQNICIKIGNITYTTNLYYLYRNKGVKPSSNYNPNIYSIFATKTNRKTLEYDPSGSNIYVLHYDHLDKKYSLTRWNLIEESKETHITIESNGQNFSISDGVTIYDRPKSIELDSDRTFCILEWKGKKVRFMKDVYLPCIKVHLTQLADRDVTDIFVNTQCSLSKCRAAMVKNLTLPQSKEILPNDEDQSKYTGSSLLPNNKPTHTYVELK